MGAKQEKLIGSCVEGCGITVSKVFPKEMTFELRSIGRGEGREGFPGQREWAVQRPGRRR